MEDADDVPSLVTKLCVLVASGAKSDVPVKKLRGLAFSILLKLDNRPKTPSGRDEIWNAAIEDRVLAKAFEMQLHSRHYEASRLRECLSQLTGQDQRCSPEVRACLEFLLHMADSGPPRRPLERPRLFELPPIVPGSTQAPKPVCLVPGIPAFPEFSREHFELLDDDLESADNQNSFVRPNRFASQPGFDPNGNPLFSLNGQRGRGGSVPQRPLSADISLRIPPLTPFTRDRVLNKFSKGAARLEPLTVPPTTQASRTVQSQAPHSQPQSTAPTHVAPTAEDWEYAIHAEKRKHFTWESVGCISSSKEKPFLTEASTDAAEAVIQYQLTSLASLTDSEVVGSAFVEERDLVRKTLLLLTGVPSDCFPYDEVERKFSIKAGTRLKGCSSKALATSLSGFIQCGEDVRFLEDLVSPSTHIMPSTLTWQAFVGGLRRYLHFFYGNVIRLGNSANTLTVLQLVHAATHLMEHIRGVANFCQSLVRSTAEGLQSMQLLCHLRRHVESCWGQEQSFVMASLLQEASKPYLRFLKEWLYDGRYNDPYGEFPMRLNEREVQMRDEGFWEHGFTLLSVGDSGTASEAPFLGEFLADIFTSAKAAMLLKVCKPQSPVLWAKQPRPTLTLAFDRQQLDEVKASSERYADAMEKELDLGPLPELCLGLIPSVEVPDEWIKAQEDRADAKSRLLYAIPRSPSSSGAKSLPSPSTATAPRLESSTTRTTAPDETNNREQRDDLLYSIPTDTHMKMSGKSTGRVVEETEQISGLGLFCEASGTYGKTTQRNLFGHASDSQLQGILYPGVPSQSSSEKLEAEAETEAAGDGKVEVPQTVGEGKLHPDSAVESALNPNKSKGATSEDVNEVASVTVSDVLLAQSGQRENLFAQEASSAAGGDHLSALAAGRLSDKDEEEDDGGSDESEAEGAGDKSQELLDCGDMGDALENWIARRRSSILPIVEEGGGDVSIVADEEGAELPVSADQPSGSQYIAEPYPTYYGVMTQEPLASSRLAFFSPGNCDGSSGDSDSNYSWDWNKVNGLCQYPLEVVLKRSLLPPLMAQMALVNRVCVSYLVTEMRLYDHLEALTNYFCFQDGEFGQALCDAVCHKLKAPMRSPADFLNVRTLNWILAQALSSSLRGECPEASNLTLDARRIPSEILPGQNILSCVILTYKVEWPLNVVITSACLQRYNKIFGFILSLRRALWALSDIWSRLKPSALPRKPDASPEFRLLQLMRHEMLHFVQLVQSYVCDQVMQTSLAELRAELGGKACTVDGLRNAHMAFLKRLCQRLLLGRRAVPVYKLLREALKTVLFFQAELAGYSWRVEADGQLSHPSFAKLANAHAKFHQTVATLCTAWLSDAMGAPSVEECASVQVPDELSQALRGARLQRFPLA
ncbi:gamma-tubulin complex component 6 isoform X2 [Haemaphysalis longicornis]